MSPGATRADDDSLFFAIKTIGLSTYRGRKPQNIRDAVRHNRREIQAELGSHGHIDSDRTHLNQTIAGPPTSQDVVLLAEHLMSDVGYVAHRRDYTQAYEFVFSLPRSTNVDVHVYFADCVQWTGERFGAEYILSADIHLDQDAPHLHLLISPIRNGEYVGAKLVTKTELDGHRDSFAKLALKYGLQEPVRRLFGQAREIATRKVLQHLEDTNDPVLRSALWSMFKGAIESNPARFALRLGIALSEPKEKITKMKTMAQIFTSKGKGREIDYRKKPIGFMSTEMDS